MINLLIIALVSLGLVSASDTSDQREFEALRLRVLETKRLTAHERSIVNVDSYCKSLVALERADRVHPRLAPDEVSDLDQCRMDGVVPNGR